MATKSCCRELFTTEFNIGFHKPLDDQCLLHAQWRSASQEERLKMKDEFAAHLRMNKSVKRLKGEAKKSAQEDGTRCAAFFDLEKRLTCPESAISIMFYKNKLSLYNFTIFVLVELYKVCFFWRGRGGASWAADEIASGLLLFVKKIARNLQRCDLTIFSQTPHQDKTETAWSGCSS